MSREDVDRFVEEQIFEEDVRAVLMMMRPNKRERLCGWHEFRSGGAQFRATISWDPAFENSDTDSQPLCIPNLAEVLESILVGSVKSQDELSAEREFAIYRAVILKLMQRLEELRSRYD